VSFLEKKPANPLPKKSSSGDIRVMGSVGLDVFCARYPVKGRYGFPNAFLERELGVKATGRNWQVTQKLARDESEA